MRENRRLYREKFAAVLALVGRRLDTAMPDAGFYLWAAHADRRRRLRPRACTRQYNVTVLPGSFLAREAHGVNPGAQLRAHRAGRAARRMPRGGAAHRRVLPRSNSDSTRGTPCSNCKHIIEQAWENRANLTPGTAPARRRRGRRRRPRRARRRASCASPRRSTASGSRTSGSRRRCCSPSACEDNRVMHGGSTQLLRQGADQVRRLRRRPISPRGGFRVVPPAVARRGAFIAQERGADALLREHRRLRRRRHHGRHLGHRRLLRADRQERAPLRRRRHRRRARAAAGQPDHHRGQLLHRRALARSSRA